jgi:hypothetical protein
MFRVVELGIGIDPADARFDRRELIARNQVGLVEQHDIGERNLILRFVSAVNLNQEMPSKFS